MALTIRAAAFSALAIRLPAVDPVRAVLAAAERETAAFRTAPDVAARPVAVREAAGRARPVADEREAPERDTDAEREAAALRTAPEAVERPVVGREADADAFRTAPGAVDRPVADRDADAFRFEPDTAERPATDALWDA
ncbi:hypothetical protein [Herbidospora mongoliensis]|uniref:hypothetical protein n=1 Tax=Herbidospora mongoliensis TaxID=688067 RepID=UPI0012F82A74|nr:hypothetical protein [Herbidospora mongoliensis]